MLALIAVDSTRLTMTSIATTNFGGHEDTTKPGVPMLTSSPHLFSTFKMCQNHNLDDDSNVIKCWSIDAFY